MPVRGVMQAGNDRRAALKHYSGAMFFAWYSAVYGKKISAKRMD
ncbi:MAG: hypothetical protein P8I38_13300 [Arenicella sp.]|nr:hypothetical protein [Arenicella sp.]